MPSVKKAGVAGRCTTGRMVGVSGSRAKTSAANRASGRQSVAETFQ
ncbi:hypothetical protein RMO66_00935 [Nocardia seriolae]|nr:hypothetical protein [Nocardia seriolae]WNJ59460.1 hypothetical protein RMO66_00935 [Nocardia seriolae]